MPSSSELEAIGFDGRTWEMLSKSGFRSIRPFTQNRISIMHRLITKSNVECQNRWFCMVIMVTRALNLTRDRNNWDKSNVSSVFPLASVRWKRCIFNFVILVVFRFSVFRFLALSGECDVHHNNNNNNNNNRVCINHTLSVAIQWMGPDCITSRLDERDGRGRTMHGVGLLVLQLWKHHYWIIMIGKWCFRTTN